MSNKDDLELDIEDPSEEEFDDATLDDETGAAADEPAPAKKKSGGGMVAVLAVLVLLGGGGVAAVKFLNIPLPFDIPGLTPAPQAASMAQQQQQPAPETAIQTAAADLGLDGLPPQPAAPQDDFGGLPGAIGGFDPDQSVTAGADTGGIAPPQNDPWGLAGGTAPAQLPQETAQESQIVDPFAFGQSASDTVAIPDSAPGDNIAADPFGIGAPAETGAPALASGTDADTGKVVDPFATQATATGAADSAPAADVTAPVSGDNAADKARIAALEKELAAAKKSLSDSDAALKKAQADLVKKADELARAQTDLKAAQQAAKDAAKTAAAKPAAGAAKTADDVKPAAAAAPKPAAAPKAAAPVRSVSWVLRSAKPGMAWVSEKGSNEMRTVSVGDTLAGIGKVTSIATDAQGRWVVNGTRGSINQ